MKRFQVEWFSIGLEGLKLRNSDLVDRLLIALLFLVPNATVIVLRLFAFGWVLIFLGIIIIGFAIWHMLLSIAFIFTMNLDKIQNYLLLLIATISFCLAYLFQIDGDGSNTLTILQYFFIPKGNIIVDTLSVYAQNIMCVSAPLVFIADIFIFMVVIRSPHFQSTKVKKPNQDLV